jgi:hypothetical protein
MSPPPTPSVSRLSSDARRELLRSLVSDVLLPQRQRLLAYRVHSNQSAQVDSDGYLSQIIASIVLGVEGNARRGKSGDLPGDLSDGTEVKSTYRVEQKGGKEDAHVNFGQISRAKMAELLDRERCVIVHTSYDVLGRLKVEVLTLSLRAAKVRAAVKAFLGRSSAEKPQLQPRLYPDGKRDVLQLLPGHFHALGATLLARAVEDGTTAIVDKWSPEKPLPLEQVLDVTRPRNAPAPRLARPADPKRFFKECMVGYRRSLIPFCSVAAANQNVGFGNLAQHLVSLVTGIRGTDSAARGADLEDGSEIKLAMGLPGDALGTEDMPRLNLQHNVAKILAWPSLYAVRIVTLGDKLAAKVLKAETSQFRSQVRDYFGPRSKYRNSKNMQYHVARDFELNSFSGEGGDGRERALACKRIFEIRE